MYWFLSMSPVFHVKILCPGSHRQCAGSQVKGLRWRVQGPGPHIKIPGPGSQEEGTGFWVPLSQYAFRSSRSEVFLVKGVFFSIRVFFHEHSRITGLQGKGEGISLTPYYHFHPLNMRLDITRAITAESSPLHMAAGLEPGTFGFRAQVANHQATRPYVHSKVF